MPSERQTQAVIARWRRQALDAGVTLAEFAERMNRMSPDDIARAMETLPTDTLAWAVKFEALSHRHELDPLEILDSLAKSCTRAEDAAFWILTSAAAHLQGFEDDEGSTAEAFYWNRVFPCWRRR
jgi:hypothetical protein